ncbi:MAG: extracellular solute-binding protein [Planctomycetaceae bacterium]|nr:extracellular solute-binding protein [Planctomycetaceae bacterium]
MNKHNKLLSYSCLILCVLFNPVWADQVIVYTSLDQVFSEPVLKEFEQQTGIQVKPVYDVEASKTTGLVNRLIAEQSNPRADVFWNSEVGRTLVLKEKGVLAPYHSPSAKDIPDQFKDQNGYWTGFAARARVLIYNTELLKPDQVPQSIFELTQPHWKGKVALAYPLFGTTATHIAALYGYLGADRTEHYLRDLKANGVVIVDGNSVSRDLVVQGELAVGFTDTDDANVAIQSGKPVKMIFPDKAGMGTLLISNTVALIKGAPHTEEGKKLIDFLLSRETERKLAFSESMQIPVRQGVDRPSHVPTYDSIRAMPINYQAISDNLERSARFSHALFNR